LTVEEAKRWLSETESLCIRPERLSVEMSLNSGLKVEAARFAGASGEVDLVDERDGSRKTFIHRPAGPTLKTGDRVLLKLLMLLVAMLFLPGCDSGVEPTLHVKHEDYWSMPPDGKRVPAPRGMTVSPEGEYLVLDNAGRVLVFNKDGDIQRQWWMPDYSVGRPEGICVLKDGRIAVADTHYHRVVFFDHEGHVTGMFGKLGTEPGEFVYPVSVIQDDAENLYVCEYGNYNDRVQKFRLDGTFVAQIGGYGTEKGQFQRPSGMALFDGLLYVTDAFNNRVQVFGEDGKLVAILGDSDKISDLHYPYDIVVNEKGELFVVEYGAGRVSKFDRKGKLLGRYGRTGTQTAQFSTPWGLAIDPRGRVYVCDTGNRRIVVLEL
jgi:DNA-binding beta-propeller fold protein YncE